MMDDYFSLVVVVFLAVAWCFQIQDFRGLSGGLRFWSQGFLVLASLAAGVLVVARFIGKDSLVIVGAVEGPFLLTVLMTSVAWFFSLTASLAAINLFLIPLVSALWVYLQWVAHDSGSVVAFSPWLWLHIVLAVCGEALLIVSALVAAAFLMADLSLRRKWSSLFVMRWTSLDEFERVLTHSLKWGFFLMTGGMILGAFFATHFWEGHWFQDPKVGVALATWLTYAMMLWLRARGRLKNARSLAVAALCACMLIVFLALGMDKLLPSRHPFQVEGGFSE